MEAHLTGKRIHTQACCCLRQYLYCRSRLPRTPHFCSGKNPVLLHPTIGEIAARKQRTPAQVVLRWALQHNQLVVPRTTKLNRMTENLQVLWGGSWEPGMRAGGSSGGVWWFAICKLDTTARDSMPSLSCPSARPAPPRSLTSTSVTQTCRKSMAWTAHHQCFRRSSCSRRSSGSARHGKSSAESLHWAFHEPQLR